jgi:hypothetical protein
VSSRLQRTRPSSHRASAAAPPPPHAPSALQGAGGASAGYPRPLHQHQAPAVLHIHRSLGIRDRGGGREMIVVRGFIVVDGDRWRWCTGCGGVLLLVTTSTIYRHCIHAVMEKTHVPPLVCGKMQRRRAVDRAHCSTRSPR